MDTKEQPRSGTTATQQAPAFKPAVISQGDRHHAQMTAATGALLTVHARFMSDAVTLVHSHGGATALLSLKRDEAAALGRELVTASGSNEPSGEHWFTTTLGAQTVIVDYESDIDGAVLGSVWIGDECLDAHEAAGLFAREVTDRWQREADAHLKQLAQDARDDAAIERAIDRRMREAA